MRHVAAALHARKNPKRSTAVLIWGQALTLFEGRGSGSTYNNYTLQIIHPAYMYMLAIQLIKGKVLRYIPAIMFTSNYN